MYNKIFYIFLFYHTTHDIFEDFYLLHSGKILSCLLQVMNNELELLRNNFNHKFNSIQRIFRVCLSFITTCETLQSSYRPTMIILFHPDFTALLHSAIIKCPSKLLAVNPEVWPQAPIPILGDCLLRQGVPAISRIALSTSVAYRRPLNDHQ
jgi:hypothetical protein